MKVKRRFRPLGSVIAAYELPPPGFQDCHTQTTEVNTEEAMCYSLGHIQKYFKQLSGHDQTKLLESLFATACKSSGITAPHGYIEHSLSAMQHLQAKGKSNILAVAAYVFGNKRSDIADSRFPTDRMPFELLEHCINFYRADSINEV